MIKNRKMDFHEVFGGNCDLFSLLNCRGSAERCLDFLLPGLIKFAKLLQIINYLIVKSDSLKFINIIHLLQIR